MCSRSICARKRCIFRLAFAARACCKTQSGTAITMAGMSSWRELRTNSAKIKYKVAGPVTNCQWISIIWMIGFIYDWWYQKGYEKTCRIISLWRWINIANGNFSTLYNYSTRQQCSTHRKEGQKNGDIEKNSSWIVVPARDSKLRCIASRGSL